MAEKKITEIFKNLVPKYLKSRRQDLITLREAIQKQDYSPIQTIGHRLKGNALSYGFPELGKIGAQMEEAAIREDIAQMSHLIDEIERFLDSGIETNL